MSGEELGGARQHSPTQAAIRSRSADHAMRVVRCSGVKRVSYMAQRRYIPERAIMSSWSSSSRMASASVPYVTGGSGNSRCFIKDQIHLDLPFGDAQKRFVNTHSSDGREPQARAKKRECRSAREGRIAWPAFRRQKWTKPCYRGISPLRRSLRTHLV